MSYEEQRTSKFVERDFYSIPSFVAAVTLVACYIPARRAMKVDPTPVSRTQIRSVCSAAVVANV